jgi:hypothetical protein
LRIAFFDATEHRLAKTIELPLKNSSHKGDFTMHGSWSSDSQWYAIGSYADNVAYFIEAATGRIVTLPLSGNPHYFDWRGTTHVFVTVEADEPKSAESRPAVVEVRFDPKNGVAEAVNTLKMTLSQAELSNPAQIEGHHANLTPDGKRIICCNRGAGGTFGGGSVDVFDVKSGKLVKHFELSLNGAGHAYLTPNGRYAVITQYNDTKLPVIDLQNLRVVTTIDAETGGHLGHAAFTDDGKCFVNNRKADEVLVISTRSWQITPTPSLNGWVNGRFCNRSGICTQTGRGSHARGNRCRWLFRGGEDHFYRTGASPCPCCAKQTASAYCQ